MVERKANLVDMVVCSGSQGQRDYDPALESEIGRSRPWSNL